MERRKGFTVSNYEFHLGIKSMSDSQTARQPAKKLVVTGPHSRSQWLSLKNKTKTNNVCSTSSLHKTVILKRWNEYMYCCAPSQKATSKCFLCVINTISLILNPVNLRESLCVKWQRYVEYYRAVLSQLTPKICYKFLWKKESKHKKNCTR